MKRERDKESEKERERERQREERERERLRDSVSWRRYEINVKIINLDRSYSENKII